MEHPCSLKILTAFTVLLYDTLFFQKKQVKICWFLFFGIVSQFFGGFGRIYFQIPVFVEVGGTVVNGVGNILWGGTGSEGEEVLSIPHMG